MKLLIFFIVIYLVYRILKSWVLANFFPNGTLGGSDRNESDKDVDDIMIKDPYCNVYFPKRNSVFLKYKGEDLYFCSKDCKEKYLKEHK